MDVQKRLNDAEDVPLWNGETGTTMPVRGVTIEGPVLPCIVRNRIGRAQLVEVRRDDIGFGDSGQAQDGLGRDILAFLRSKEDAAACIKAFPAILGEGISNVQAAMSTQLSLAGGASKSKAQESPSSVSKEIDPQVILARTARNWFNCGRAAVSIQEDLEDLGGSKPPSESAEFEADTFAAFLSLFSQAPKVPLLIDVTINGIHTFTIEMQTADLYYVVQGYQGRYSAFWWQGLAERPQDLSLPSDARESQVREATELLAPTRLLRDTIGVGKALDLDTLATYVLVPLRTLMRAGVWNAEARRAWKELPFFTNEIDVNFPQARATGEEDLDPEPPKVILMVKVVALTNWALLYERLDGARPASICGLIVRRANELYERYLKLAKEK